MSNIKIGDFDNDDVPEEYIEIVADIKIAAQRIDDILKEYNANVVMSTLSSAMVQAICQNSNSLAEAQTTAANLSIFLLHAINSSDDMGICGWNQTRQ